MLHWQIGDVRVTRIQELELPGIAFVLPDATRENVKPISWLFPDFVTPGGDPLASVHALVLETPSQRIVVDTCIGNDKRRPIAPWNLRSGPFLSDFEAAGFPREGIDRVLCTHLHVDHVGWNTMRVEARWVPTFPNARYLVARSEWEHWNTQSDAFTTAVLDDSIRPIWDAGLVDLVDEAHRVCDEVYLEHTPGHTPGHVAVCIESQGLRAVITGDLIHHPCQMARPGWGCPADSDADRARATRLDFLERHADTPTLIIGTHFAGPTAGHIRRDGDVFRFEA